MEFPTRAEIRKALLLAPLGRRRMHVRVKFFDGRRDARDTAGHPFEGQPHSGFRRAKCPHLVDIREGQAAGSRTDLPGSNEGYGSAGSRPLGSLSAPDWERPSSEAHTNCQLRFALPARRYEARSLTLANGAPHDSDDVELAVANIVGPSDSQRRALAGNGRTTRLGNEIDWVKGAGDREFGLFERVGPKLYRLTPYGKKVAAGDVDLDPRD